MVNPIGNNTLLPSGWGIVVGTTAQLALPANPSRSGVIWINQSSAQIAICPGLITSVPQGTAVSGFTLTPAVAGVPVIGGAGSITMLPGDKFIIDNLPCGCQWNAIASAAGANLTAIETY